MMYADPSAHTRSNDPSARSGVPGPESLPISARTVRLVEERLVGVDGCHLGTRLGGEQQRGPARAAAQVEDARTVRQRAGEGEQLPSGGVGAGALPRQVVVQGEERLVTNGVVVTNGVIVVGQRGKPLSERAPANVATRYESGC
jgi:hypothetical protein